ncbi:hypothetical protein [Nocardia cyriacigeorgica]|uniref:hypothetical protein n=1 Tax=Nocardia cyriacigeorgica TaxID=135487 RepID=UPI001032ACB4|nr:hypothetical protein [Nocardia cyriacigeorgica]MBF6093329.1 hypothetical protein [Nocardia cyriacigeorgica]MBF6100319.1 hypothetical protein [Nocardia cyriacigeorgica]MBF6517623.1 hypothetical protein [Nocardia cyriacigeorgica]
MRTTTNLRRTTVAAALAATVALAIPAGPDAAAHAQPGVSYHASLAGTSVVTELETGRFTVDDRANAVAIHDDSGARIDAVPLSYTLDGQRLRLSYDISADGRTLTLTPSTSGLDRRALTPVASPLENQLAMNDLINAVSIGTSLGTLVGTAVGALAGVGVGLLVSGASCAVLSLGCVVAVLPIVSLSAGVGGIAGLIIAGGPVAAAAAFDYVSTLHAAPGSTKYAEQTRGKPGGPPAQENTAPASAAAQ